MRIDCSESGGGVQPDDSQGTLVMGAGERNLGSGVLPGAVAERYRVRRVLGKGGFGIVYLAEDVRIGRLVAVKQLFDRWAGSEDFRTQFLQEARIAGRLGHPNIVSIYNLEGEGEGGGLCIIMEYLGGGSLEDLLRKEGMLDVCLSLKVMAGVLSGLDAAHHEMIVHSDIKPPNILFGVGGIPKVADFGTARSSSVARLLGRDGLVGINSSIAGTPQYMSPEQSSGCDYDCRADVYSAGAVLYRMLSGEELFRMEGEARDADSLRQSVMGARPRPMAEFRKDVPDFVEALLLRMLSKEPSGRPRAQEALREIFHAVARLRDLCPKADGLMFEPSCQIVNSPAAILEDIISLLLVDGVISPSERVELAKRAERLGLSESQARSIERRLRMERGLPDIP